MDDLPEGVAREPDEDPEASGLPGALHPAHRDGRPEERHCRAAARNR